MENDGCGMSEYRKGGKEWVRVDKSGIFFKCGKVGGRSGESGQELNGVE